MARIQNVEKAQFINNNIEIYAQNKVGQYSKFLDKTPIFVTYYHISQTLSRADVGTGGIESELGPRSPVRFNKILTFPLYNLPDIKPDVTYDETGMDIDLELSDIVVLPGTIRPTPGDYFILGLPHAQQFLFRVNSFRHNTIQSNDFYSLDCDIKEVGEHLEDGRIATQVIGEYQTVFDNIGTEDRCFVKSSDIDYLNSIVDLYYKLRDYYHEVFYYNSINSFTLPMGFDLLGKSVYLYDPYLEKFINESKLYYDENVEKTVVLTPQDILPKNFKLNYSKSLYATIISRNKELLCRYPYSSFEGLRKKFSTYQLEEMQASTTNLYMLKEKLPENTDPYTPVAPEGPNQNIYQGLIDGIPVDDQPINNQDGVWNQPWYSILNLPKWIPVYTCKAQYFDFDFIGSILDGSIETDDYYQLIIFNWVNHIAMQYNRADIINALTEDIHGFYFIPMITYIFGQLYQEYFHKDSAFEL